LNTYRHVGSPFHEWLSDKSKEAPSNHQTLNNNVLLDPGFHGAFLAHKKSTRPGRLI